MTAWGEKADSILEVEMVAHALGRTWIKNIFFALSGSTPDAPQYDVNVKVRSTGQIVYSLRLDAGVAADEGFHGIDENLKKMTLEEFCSEYGFPIPT